MTTTQWNYTLHISGILLSTHELTYRVQPHTTKKSLQLQQILALLGGIAGLDRLLMEFRKYHPKYGRTRLKKLLHGERRIESIGGGYYSLTELTTLPVHRWLYWWLFEHGPQTAENCILAILSHYPHGNANAIKRWLQQGPKNLRILGKTYDCWLPKGNHL